MIGTHLPQFVEPDHLAGTRVPTTPKRHLGRWLLHRQKDGQKWLPQPPYPDPIGNILGTQTHEQWTSHLQFLNRFTKLTLLLKDRHHGVSK